MALSFPLILAYLAVLIASLFSVIAVRRHRYQLDKCFLFVSHGVIWRHNRSYEIIHLQEAGIERGLFDTLTGNARLVLNFSQGGKVELKGMVRAREAEELRTDLLNLARMLRMNPLSRVIER